MLAINAQWKVNNYERDLARRRSYYKEWRSKNPDKVSTANAKFYYANRQKMIDKALRWRSENLLRDTINQTLYQARKQLEQSEQRSAEHYTSP